MAYIRLMVKLFITTVGLRRETRHVAYGERLRQLNLFTLTSFVIFIDEIDMCSPDFFLYHPAYFKRAHRQKTAFCLVAVEEHLPGVYLCVTLCVCSSCVTGTQRRQKIRRRRVITRV